MDLLSAMAVEYGVTPDVRGALEASRLSYIGRVSESAPRIQSAGLYVGICRRIMRCVGYDGRLIACAWNHLSPHDWVTPDGSAPIDNFVAYWNATQKRPGIAGSSYNAQPEHVFALWRAGVYAHYTRQMGDCAGISLVEGRVVWKLAVRAIRMARALRRVSAQDMYQSVARRGLPRESDATYQLALTEKAWAAMGRVSAEMQEAMVDTIVRRRLAGDRRSVLRPTDLPWDVAARVQADMLADSTGRVRAAWSRGEKRARLLRAVHRPVLPGYPDIEPETALRLVRGDTPVEIAQGELTRAEAHRWMLDGARQTPTEWLCARHSLPTVRSMPVARWLLSVRRRGQWSVLIRERSVHGPGGQTLLGRYIDRVDEIQDEDLDRGASTGVERAYEHAVQRSGSQWLERARGDLRILAPLPTGWRFPMRVQPIRTPAALVREGEEMDHCVGGYARAVERGQSIVVSIRAFGHRSTAELSPSGQVLQHHGPRNEAPHPVCEAVLAHFLARNGLERRAA